MSSDSRTECPTKDQRSRPLRTLVRGVLSALVSPAMLVSVPLMKLIARQRRRSARCLAIGEPTVPRPRAASSSSVPARRGSGSSNCAPATSRTATGRKELFSTVSVQPGFSSAHYPATFAALQLRPSPKLLDLVPARMLGADLFEQLADAWGASSDTVPQLGILLSFERWVLLGTSALTALQPLSARGVRVEVFYEEQTGQLGGWFAGGRVVHDVAAVIASLAERWQLGPSWQPAPSWPVVLEMLTRLVRAYTRAADLPALLIEIAELALSCGGAEEAAMLAREALYYLPEKASALRSKALCELGAALMDQGEIATGVAAFDEAVTTAAASIDPAIGASALCQSGLHAFQRGDYPGAERRFRGAIDLLSCSERRPHLRALVHHYLAIALMHQGKEDAEHHASIALALRPDAHGPLADVDRLLLAKLAKARANVSETNHAAIALPLAPTPQALEAQAQGSLGSSGSYPQPPRDHQTSRASVGGLTVATDGTAPINDRV